MPSPDFTICYRIVPTDPTCIEVRDEAGNLHTTITAPTGCRLRMVRPPWWTCLFWWARVQVWRLRTL